MGKCKSPGYSHYFYLMKTIRVTRITVYPIKSLDGVDVPSALFHEGGGLVHDRQYAIRDDEGKWVNGKSTPAIHRLRSFFDERYEQVRFSVSASEVSPWFPLTGNRDRLNEYLSDTFGKNVWVEADPLGGLQDDPVKNQVTLVSVQTLQEVCSWFEGMSLDECRKRFRVNVELDADYPFEEESWLKSPPSSYVTVGNTRLRLSKRVPRCVVPSRNPITGAVWTGFQKTFSDQRKQLMHDGAKLPAHDHGYFLSVGSIREDASTGTTIRVSDAVIPG